MKKRSGIRFYSSKIAFGMKKRIDLYEQIRAMMNEGMPIVDVISDLESIYKSENKSDPRVYMLGCWRKAMEQQGSILREIVHWVPESEVVMFKTAEETGEWAKCLESLIFQVEKQNEIKKVVLSQMGYPVFLSIFLIAILYGFGSFGVPMLSEMLPVNRWPEFSMPLHDISVFISTKFQWVILSIVGLLVITFMTQARYVGAGRIHLDKIPPYSIYKSMQGASFLISLASLLKSGIPVIESVKIIEKNSSPWSRWKINDINRSFSKGDTGAGALIKSGKNSMFSREVRVQIKAYSKLAEMDRAMYKIGVVAIEITTSNVKAITGLVKMVMIFFVAISIVWIYASFIQVSQMASQAI